MINIEGTIIDYRTKEDSNTNTYVDEGQNEARLVPSAPLSTKENPVRPQVVAGFTTRYRYGEYGSVYITLNYDIITNNLIEMFITSSQTSARNQAYTNVLARMISNQIKHGVPIRTIYKHMIDMDEGQPTFVKFPDSDKPMLIKSIPDLIGNVLRKFPTYSHLEELVFESAEEEEDKVEEELEDNGRNVFQKKQDEQEQVEVNEDVTDFIDCAFNHASNCPDAQWVVEAGCSKCLTCNYSACG